MPSELPWSVPTPQENGRKAERNKAKKMGARLHPASGARGIKNDFSTQEEVVEYKAVNKSHTIKGDDIKKLFENAVYSGKEGVYMIHFIEVDLTLTCRISRGA